MPLPAFTSLVTAQITVRPVEENDLSALLDVNGDPEVTRFLPYATWQSLDDGRAWLERMQGLEASGTTRQLVIVHNGARRAIGTVLLFKFDEGSARLELGYVLGREFWGRGLMHEALTTVCRHAFEAMALRRIEAEVQPDNTASNSLLQRLGFVLEGRFRRRWVAKGAAYDTNFYGCLAEDWRARS